MTELELIRLSPINTTVALAVMVAGVVGIIGFLSGGHAYGTECLCVFLIGHSMWTETKVNRILGICQKEPQS